MKTERWRQIEQLYHAARERQPGERDRFLQEACADEKLRGEVESLLGCEAQAEGFLEASALQVTAEALAEGRARSMFGRMLGHYQVVAFVGAGGMGEVYRAKDTKLGRDVALKILPPAFASDPDRMARFEREARVLASLDHPNIAAIYGLEESSGIRALVMALIEGPTLAERIAAGSIPLDEAVQIARQIAEAVEYAHERGIIHRDLKPANIIVTSGGMVKVLDFGLAKALDDEHAAASNSPALTTGATRAGVLLGTAAYMSPEQAQGKPVDKRADIWAFGVVLYEMLTGRRMFQGETAGEVLASVIKDEPKLDNVPLELRGLVSRCLNKDARKRLQAIGEARIILEDPAPPAPVQQVPMQCARSLPWMTAVGLAVVAASLTVVAAAALWVAWRATRPVDRPLMRFSVDLGPEAVEGPSITAAISPDGKRLAFVASGPGGKKQLATRLLDQAKATLLPGTENAADPFFSPDGQWIGFFAGGKMKKISVEGGAAVTLCDTPGPRGASWGEDGFIIVTLINSLDGGLLRVPEAGGTPQAITKPADKGEATHRWPQILPGGLGVLFTGNTVLQDFDNASIEVLSLKTGQWKVVQRGGYFGRYLPTSKGAGHLVYLHQGTLFAVGFDLDRLEIRGTPAPLLEEVAGNPIFGGGQYDVARNGTLVYLSGKSSTASWPVAWMDSSGKTQPLPAAPGPYYNPRFSPDGRRLALSVGPPGGGDIQLYDWQRDKMSRLTFTQRNLYAIWTPDGKHIAFVSQSPGANSMRWIRADGAGEAQPLLDSKFELRPYSFSPDGKRLAFAEMGVDTGFDLWTLPLDVSDPEHAKPGKPELFLRTPLDEREPAFSPDGRWMAYASNESGRFEIYVRPFPGGAPSGSGKWQTSAGGGMNPMWSRNGRELFYESPDNLIMAAVYAANADSFTADKPRPWSNTQILEPVPFLWNLDLAPAGKRFAVFPKPDATGEQKSSVHVTVLLNFFDELRRRVPPGGK
jgi:Tol biopolymer transport system component